jgi:hypothetical protein
VETRATRQASRGRASGVNGTQRRESSMAMGLRA